MKRTLLLILLLSSLAGYSQVNLNNNTVQISNSGILFYNFIHAATNFQGTYTPSLTQNIALKLIPTYTVEDTNGITVVGDTFKLYKTEGDYMIQIQGSATSGTNDDFRIQMRENNVSETCTAFFTTNGANNYTGFCYFWYVDVVEDTWISFWITNLTNNNDPTIRCFDVYIEKKPE